MPHIMNAPQRGSLRFVQNRGKVMVLANGQLIGELDWRFIDQIAKQMVGIARKAEEWEKAEQIAMESAILMRSGAPFTLSSRPDIMDEAAKEAAHNRDLRRYMKGGVKAKAKFGTPEIVGGA